MFASDNGPWVKKSDEGGSAGPFRDGKVGQPSWQTAGCLPFNQAGTMQGTTWEGGLRVPAIVSYPSRLAKGEVSLSVMSLLDLYPTFAGLAGVKLDASEPLDGQDIWPLVSISVVFEDPGC
jgi:arylsulfatase A-like enzyme